MIFLVMYLLTVSFSLFVIYKLNEQITLASLFLALITGPLLGTLFIIFESDNIVIYKKKG